MRVRPAPKQRLIGGGYPADPQADIPMAPSNVCFRGVTADMSGVLR